MQQFKLILSFFLLLFFPFGNIHSQNEVNQLFQNDDILSLKLSYSNKDIQRKTNDSTYIETDLFWVAMARFGLIFSQNRFQCV